MADAPARALVIFGDGLASALAPPPSLSHLHHLAARGACGFLALRGLPPQVKEEEGMLIELAQLLDVYDTYTSEAQIEDCSIPYKHHEGLSCKSSISERFMGMKAALITTKSHVANFGERFGFTVKILDEIEDGSKQAESKSGLPNAPMVASTLLNLLAINNKENDNVQNFDLVFLHVGASSSEVESCNEGIAWIDSLIGQIKSLEGEKSKSLYIALVLGYGSMALKEENLLGKVQHLSLTLEEGMPPELIKFRPEQSYKWKNGSRVTDVRSEYPLLVVHQMDSVTRLDNARCLTFEEFQKNGGSLAILADSFLHELAFKLWKAPKYGA